MRFQNYDNNVGLVIIAVTSNKYLFYFCTKYLVYIYEFNYIMGNFHKIFTKFL